MFHLLSKILMFILSPYYWIVFLLLFGVFSKNKLRKKKSFWAAAVIYFIFGNSALLNIAYKAIEPLPFFQFHITTPFEYGVLLGGGFVAFDESLPDRIIFNESANRLTESLELFYSQKIKNLIISGGAGGIGRVKNIEAVHAQTFLGEIQFPDSALIIESKSKNTYENGVFVKQILDSLKYDGTILLITSAVHMPRAMAVFKKQGINAMAYPADYEQKSKLEYTDYILPGTHNLYEWQLIFKEWVGYLVYKLKGYI